MEELAYRIYNFLEIYACLNPNWDAKYDEVCEKYTSPDAAQLRECADLFLKGIKPKQAHSDWESGGYKPYTSKEGKKEHNEILKQIYKFINNEK